VTAVTDPTTGLPASAEDTRRARHDLAVAAAVRGCHAALTALAAHTGEAVRTTACPDHAGRAAQASLGAVRDALALHARLLLRLDGLEPVAGTTHVPAGPA
jgi:hypothetical protein